VPDRIFAHSRYEVEYGRGTDSRWRVGMFGG